jgi:hypothetical protein
MDAANSEHCQPGNEVKASAPARMGRQPFSPGLFSRRAACFVFFAESGLWNELC